MFIILWIPYCLFTQTTVLDSIRKEIIRAETDSARVYWHGRMVWNSFNFHTDTVEIHLQKAKLINSTLEDQAMAIKLKHYHGLLHRVRGEYAAAIDTFKQVAAHYEQRNDSLAMSGSLFNLGVIYSYIGNYEKSLEYYYKDLRIHEKNNNQGYVANAWNSIGIIHKNRKNYTEAIKCYNKAQEIYENEVENPGMLATVYNNKANVFLELGDFDQVQYFAEKSKKIDEQIERPWGIAHSLNTLGIAARETGDYSTAEKMAKRAIEINQKLNQPQELSNAYLNYGEVMLARRNFPLAKLFIYRAIALSDSIDYVLGLKQGYQSLTELFESQNQFQEAYKAQQNFIIFQDSILNQEKVRSMKNLEIQYEVEKQELTLNKLTQENQLQGQINQRIRQSNIAWTIASTLFALLFLISIYWYRNRLAKNKLLATKEAALQQAQIQQLEQKQKVLTLNAMINGQEEERQRIAKDLHDSLGSLLTTVKLNFKAIHQRTKKLEKVNGYEKVDELLDHASQEVRRISQDMMPDVLKISLSEGIKEIANNIQASSSITVNFQEFGTKSSSLTNAQKVMVYRIVQELTQNALKHASASHIILQLSWLGDRLQVVVEDNGLGFDPENVKKGLGLRSIQSRTEYLKGELDLDSKPGIGTTITIDIPTL